MDEVDDLYRKGAATPEIKQTTIDILSDLAMLGDQVTGLFATLLCGSSANIPMLIARNSFAEMKDEFPVLEFSGNLNGTKFRDVHIPSSLPTTLENIPELLNQPGITQEARRLVAFFAGTTPRNVQHVAKSRSTPGQLDLLSADESYLGANTLSNDTLKKFVNMIQDHLLEKNASVIQKFFDKNKNFDPRMIYSEPWETQFKPSTFDEIKKLYDDRLQQPGRVLSKSVFSDLCRLHFASWIILDGVEESVPKSIYPVALFQLVKLKIAKPQRKDVQEFFSRALDVILEKGKEMTVTDLADTVVLRTQV